LSKNEKQKCLVIGLDGATFDILTPLMDRGLMPNLKRIVGQGSSGNLHSVTPPVSGPAWVSFMTGKDPGRHGIYDFHQFLPGRCGKRVVSFNDIAGKSLWEVLSGLGRKVGVINVPVTYPPYPVDGFMITGMLTPPDAEERRMHPPSLYHELKAKFGEYISDVWWTQYGSRQKADLLRDLIGCMNQRQKITTYLMEQKEWDFLITTITETDRLQHAFASDLFGTGAPSKTSKSDGEIKMLLDRFYMEMDEHIGELYEKAGEDTTVFIVSDHGFGITSHLFLANRWLHDLGLLRINWKEYYKNFWMAKLAASPTLRKIVRALDPFGLRKRFRKRAGEDRSGQAGGSDEAVGEYQRLFTDCIDWSRSVAFMDLDDQQGIYINLKGREPDGIVEPADYEKTRDRVIQALGRLIDPETGRPVVTSVRRREEVYEGASVENAPDLVVEFKKFEIYGIGLLGLNLFRNPLFQKPVWPCFSGHHRPEGVFVGCGPRIKKNMKVEGNLIDLFPTILYSMNLPIPNDLDGRVMETVFTEAYSTSHPILWQKASESTREKGGSGSLSPVDNDKLIESLKGLGYL
jgi:predicted AlkP superfamily phosphohydrolase/phosphomutase